MRTTIHSFLKNAKEAHGSKYDYSKVVYETTEKKVIIICKIHGEFLMRPRAHCTDLRGCPKCSDPNKSGFSYNSKWAEKVKTLYLIELAGNGERFLKIGVTNEIDIEKRFQKGQLPPIYSYKVLRRINSSKSSLFERQIAGTFIQNKYLPKISFRGSTECFNFKVKTQLLIAFDQIK